MQIINGFGTKTVNIRLIQGKRQYNLSNNKTLGLPDDVFINNMYLRNKGRSINNRDLSFLGNTCYLTLKDLSGKSIYNQMLGDLLIQKTTATSDGATYPPDILIQPFRAIEIDWINSFVEFPDPSALTTDQEIELTILYSRPGTETIHSKALKTFKNYMGANGIGIRTSQLQINTKAFQTRYNLAFQNMLGVPDESIFLGFNVVFGDFKTLDGNLDYVKDTTVLTSFLTLKKRGTYLLLDDFPMWLKQPQNGLWPYFPVEPTGVKDIDWETSYISISDKDQAKDDEAFVLILYFLEC